jgi:hypothetical protein
VQSLGENAVEHQTLVGKVEIERAPRDPGSVDDQADRSVMIAMLGEDLFGRCDDLVLTVIPALRGALFDTLGCRLSKGHRLLAPLGHDYH